VVPGDGVEPSVHGFTDRCLDHLATLGYWDIRVFPLHAASVASPIA